MKHREHILDEAAEWVLRLNESNDSNFDVTNWREWMSTSPEHQSAFKKMLKVWGLTDVIVVEEWLNEPLDQPGNAVLQNMQSVQPKRKQFNSRLLAIAASLLVIPMVAVIWFISNSVSNQPSLQAYTKTFQTDKKQHESFILPDGSIIELGAQSKVSVEFSDSSRQVKLLSGEGYFVVAKDTNRPFTVQSESATARAVGTAFNVRSNAYETTVTVLEGLVEVNATGISSTGQSVPTANNNNDPVLAVGEAISVQTGGELGPVTTVDPEQETAWRRGQLTFMNRDLRSVVADLNRYSDYTIVLEGGEVPHLRFSGVVHMEKITNWIDALPIVFDVDVRYVNEEILIQERAQL